MKNEDELEIVVHILDAYTKINPSNSISLAKKALKRNHIFKDEDEFISMLNVS